VQKKQNNFLSIFNFKFYIMKNKIFIAALVLFTTLTSTSFAQYNPYSDGSGLVSAGLGISGWGVPIYVRYEHPVADNVTVGGTFSFQTKSDTYGTEKWRNTYYGVNARGSYHFNELLNASDEWDFYGGANLGYFFWNGKYEGSAGNYVYSGSGANTFGIGVHAGARYFVNENLGINLEIGGGSALSGATIGVTFLL
jgi:hypothetical protein